MKQYSSQENLLVVSWCEFYPVCTSFIMKPTRCNCGRHGSHNYIATDASISLPKLSTIPEPCICIMNIYEHKVWQNVILRTGLNG